LNNLDTYPENQKLAEKVMDYWVQFARTGSPNRDGLPQWPEYRERQKSYLILDDTISRDIDLRKDASDTLDAAVEGLY